MTTPYSVAIVGGGIVGRATALASIRHGVRTALIAPHTPVPPHAALRVLMLNNTSVDLLRTIGLWDAIQPYLHTVTRMTVTESAEDRDALTFDHTHMQSGILAYTIREDRLLSAFETACNRASRDGRLTHIASPLCHMVWHPDAVRLFYDDNRHIDAQLVCAADGANSFVRKTLGITTKTHEYGESTLLAHLTAAYPEPHAAYQRFVCGKPFALLPMTDGGEYGLVWTMATAEAEYMRTASAKTLTNALLRYTNGAFDTLQLTSARCTLPLIQRRARSFAGQRTCLLGDAAYTVHPLAGQGLNLHLADVTRITDVLATQSTRGNTIETVRLHARMQQCDAKTAQAAIDAIRTMYTAPIPHAYRTQGTHALDRLHNIKRLLARAANGFA